MFSVTGEQGIILPCDSATESDSRPTSASSTERPASSTSSHTGAIIGNARVRLREVSEEKVDDTEKPDCANLPTNVNDETVYRSSSDPQPSEHDQPSMEQPLSSNEEELQTTDNDISSSIAKSPACELEGSAPPNETKIKDIVDGLPPNVISRTGTPDTWAFDDKDGSLHAKPPRPNSSTLCSPPMPHKAPVSVDHHLRK